MSNNSYWDLFYKSGKIEQYLRYRGNMQRMPKGSDYAGVKESEAPESQSDCN